MAKSTRPARRRSSGASQEREARARVERLLKTKGLKDEETLQALAELASMRSILLGINLMDALEELEALTRALILTQITAEGKDGVDAAPFYSMLASFYDLQGRQTAVLHASRSALALLEQNPSAPSFSFAHAYLALGSALYNQQFIPQAIEALESFLHLCGEGDEEGPPLLNEMFLNEEQLATAFLQRADCYSRMNRYEEAQAAFREAENFMMQAFDEAGMIEFRITFANFLERQGEHLAAMEQLGKVEKLLKTGGALVAVERLFIQFRIGLIQIQAGLTGEAEKLLASALKQAQKLSGSRSLHALACEAALVLCKMVAKNAPAHEWQHFLPKYMIELTELSQQEEIPFETSNRILLIFWKFVGQKPGLNEFDLANIAFKKASCLFHASLYEDVLTLLVPNADKIKTHGLDDRVQGESVLDTYIMIARLHTGRMDIEELIECLNHYFDKQAWDLVESIAVEILRRKEDIQDQAVLTGVYESLLDSLITQERFGEAADVVRQAYLMFRSAPAPDPEKVAGSREEWLQLLNQDLENLNWPALKEAVLQSV